MTSTTPAAVSSALDSVPAATWSALATRRIFFGHQSVGANLAQGLDSLLASHPAIPVRSVRTGEPATVAGGGVMHFNVGENGDAIGKTDAFIRLVEGSDTAPLDIAMHKYCYADFDKHTSVDSVFSAYVRLMEELRRERPGVLYVHVTAPLLEERLFLKDIARRVLGKTTLSDRLAKVREFNTLLRAHYAGREPIFDLAAIEAGVRPGGGVGGDALSPEYATPDGGHLNPLGQQVMAGEFLLFLASLPHRVGS